MKDKILMFIIGFLVGAIITAGGFLIFGNNENANSENMPQADGNFTPDDMDFNNIDLNNIDLNNIPTQAN